MRLFMRILAASIILIVVILLPLTLFAYQVGHILYSPKEMLNLFAVHVIGPSQSNLLTETILRSLPDQLGIAPDSIVGQTFSRAADQKELHGSILPSELQLAYAAQGINAFYNWLDGPDPMPVLELQMEPIKSYLGGNTAALVETVLEQIPVCTLDESLALASGFLGGLLSGEGVVDSIPPCLPALVPIDTIAPVAGELIRQQITLIPNTIVLDKLVTASPEYMLQLKGKLQLAKGVLQWSWLPFVFLLLIAAILGGQTNDGIPRWLGWSLILTSFSTFVFTLVPISWWLSATATRLADWPLLFRGPALVILDTVYSEAQKPLFWVAIVMMILGIVSLTMAFFIKRRQPKMA